MKIRFDYFDCAVEADMEKFAEHIDETGHWTQTLSGGEQQRIGIARALLNKPDFIFFDEATAAMDEKYEERLYKMLHELMPDTTIVSIGHRSTLKEFHEKIFVTRKKNGVFQLARNLT